MVGLGGIIGAIIIGGVAGWIASLIMKTEEGMGLLGYIIVGIIGAVIGNLVFGLLGFEGTTGFSFQSLLVSTLGAVILLFVIRLFNRPRT